MADFVLQFSRRLQQGKMLVWYLFSPPLVWDPDESIRRSEHSLSMISLSLYGNDEGEEVGSEETVCLQYHPYSAER